MRLAKKRKACHRRNERGNEDKEAMFLMTGLIAEPIWGPGLSHRPRWRGISSPSVTGRHPLPTPSLGMQRPWIRAPLGWPRGLRTMQLCHIPPRRGQTRPSGEALRWRSPESGTQSCPWWRPRTGWASGGQGGEEGLGEPNTGKRVSRQIKNSKVCEAEVPN